MTDRLLLRRFDPSDAAAVHAYLSDPEVVRFEPYGPMSLQEAALAAAERADDPAFWAVCLRDSGRLVGNIWLCPTEPAFSGWELGYVLGRDAQGHGYASEACRALLDLVFQEWGAHRVYARCNPENTASWRLLERLGLRREAHRRQNATFKQAPDGQPIWNDSYEYAVLAGEWAPHEAGPHAR